MPYSPVNSLSLDMICVMRYFGPSPNPAIIERNIREYLESVSTLTNGLETIVVAFWLSIVCLVVLVGILIQIINMDLGNT